MFYLSIKALHIFFVTGWFAGLFYLPRLFVNLAMCTQAVEYDRLLLMAHKLYRFMQLIGMFALFFGVWLWLGFGVSGGWLHAKLLLVIGLLAYQLVCGRICQTFAKQQNQRHHKWYRFFNEVPTVLLLLMVFLVVLKPF